MLDENLPTYTYRQSSDSPLHTILFFSQNGSDPAPSYLVMRADPAVPTSRNKYAVALTDVSTQSIIYAETLVEPSWAQPTLSQAEIRAANGAPPPAVPITPDTIALNLYNPDSEVVIRTRPGSWGKSDSWEFELPEQSFRAPSGSTLDRERDTPPIADVVPRVMFRWKKESRLGKEMTCYMVGRSIDGRRSKEPDITIAMFKEGKHGSTVTIYEPHLRRVDIEDQKGLEVVLLLSAEVVRDLYFNPKIDPFNVSGAPSSLAAATANGRGRRNTGSPAAGERGRTTSATAVPVMSGGAASGIKPTPSPQQSVDPRKQQEIDAETKRLRAMVAEEERQEQERQARERERRDAEEAQRIKAMLEQEEAERRRKEAEIEQETERLRREYGVSKPTAEEPVPNLPPRRQQQQQPPQQAPPSQQPNNNPYGYSVNQQPNNNPYGYSLPQRPVSAGPSKPNGPSMSGGGAGWNASSNPSQGGGKPGKKPSNPLSSFLGGKSSGLYSNPAASVSNFFQRHRDGDGDRTRGGVDDIGEEERRKLSKKRSTHF